MSQLCLFCTRWGCKILALIFRVIEFYHKANNWGIFFLSVQETANPVSAVVTETQQSHLNCTTVQ